MTDLTTLSDAELAERLASARSDATALGQPLRSRVSLADMTPGQRAELQSKYDAAIASAQALQAEHERREKAT